MFAEGLGVRPVGHPAVSVVSKHGFDVCDGADEKHAGTQRRGMRKSLAVPSEMLPHTSELMRPPLGFKLPSMCEKDFETHGQ